MKTKTLNLVRLLLLLCLTATFSCKKDPKKDQESPSLIISSPAVGTSFNMYDTIRVEAQFKDETNLSSIVITLRDMNGVVVQAAGTEPLSGNSKYYTTFYVLYEYRLKTGDYLLELSLSDGTNVTTKTVQIHIIESPTYLKGFYIVHSDINSSSLNKYDTNFVNTNIIPQTTSYNSSQISNYNQLLYYTHSTNQSLKVVDLITNQNKWEVTGLGVTNSLCAVNESGVYFSKDQGNVVTYNHQGLIVRSYLSNEPDYFVKHLFACGKYLVVNLENLSSSTSRKTVFFEIATGIVKYVLNDNKECTLALSHSDNEIYLITNNGSGSIIGNLNLTSLNYYQPVTSTSKINSATLVDGETMLFSTADGNIKQYTYTNGNVVSLISGINSGTLFYSEKFNKLYSAQAKNLVVYNKAAFALSFDRQYVSSDTIRDFHIIYNK